jgi:hypothetical protein
MNRGATETRSSEDRRSLSFERLNGRTAALSNVVFRVVRSFSNNKALPSTKHMEQSITVLSSSSAG